MSKIFVAGHRGMVGSAIIRMLNKTEHKIIIADRNDVDLTNQSDVKRFFNKHKIDQVYLAAAKVGGIQANKMQPADFIYENLMIQNNIINQSFLNGVKKLLFLGSSCIYPRLADQPMKEDALLTGYLEPTNEPYALAKICGIKMCESYNRQYGTDFRSVMPTNLYGPGDNFHDQNSHVIPALIRRLHEAKLNQSKSIDAWGSGSPLREFLHVDDLAMASLYVMNLDSKLYDSKVNARMSHINVGTGIECSIKNLAESIAEIVGFKGDILWDNSKPDGAPRKLMDSSKMIDLGWRPKYNLETGLSDTYKWFLNNISSYRG